MEVRIISYCEETEAKFIVPQWYEVEIEGQVYKIKSTNVAGAKMLAMANHLRRP